MQAFADQFTVEQRLAKIHLFPPGVTKYASTPAAQGKIPATKSGEVGLVHLNGEDFSGREITLQKRDWKTGEMKDVVLPAKSPDKIKMIARMLKENNAGIVSINELLGKDDVDAQANLQEISKTYFDDNYTCLVLPSNDPFGKHVGLMIRNDLAVNVTYESYANQRFNEDIIDPFHVDIDGKHSNNILYHKGKNIYSRGLGVATIRDAETGKVLMVFENDHKKSQFTSEDKKDRPDADGDLLRGIQADTDAAITDTVEKKFPGRPIFSGGDMNDVSESPVFASWRTRMTNLFDFLGVPTKDRLSNVYTDKHDHKQYSAIDAMSANQAAQNMKGLIKGVKIGIYRNDEGKALDFPVGKEENELPSDHKPVITTIDLGVLYQNLLN